MSNEDTAGFIPGPPQALVDNVAKAQSLTLSGPEVESIRDALSDVPSEWVSAIRSGLDNFTRADVSAAEFSAKLDALGFETGQP